MDNHNQDNVLWALGKLMAWLETWKTKEGGYNGFVIHRFETKRMRHIHDTAWTQAAIIRGYANLYRKSPEDRWYSALKEAADLQLNRYDKSTGKYDFAGHEDDRYCSLVHCALANCALLDSAPLLDKKRQNQYIEAVCGNVERYWMPDLWVEQEGAFRFSQIDYQSLNEHRFVINFNTMAAECLLKLYHITGKALYEKTALHVGEWLLGKSEHARKFYKDKKKGTLEKNQAPQGGLPYQYTPTQQNPDNCVCLYAGLALRGIAELYRHTKNEEYARIAKETMGFLITMRDPQTRLFYHTTNQDEIERYPQFIAGAGMALVGLDEAAHATGEICPIADTVVSILGSQYPNGSIPSFIGKNTSGKRIGNGVVWEDVATGPNWNAQIFEYLTRIVDDPSKIRSSVSVKSNIKAGKRFIYFDNAQLSLIFSWWPMRSMGVYLMAKKADKGVALYPVGIYGALRRLTNKFRS